MIMPIIDNDLLERKIRSGRWEELAIGTPKLIERALENERNQEAGELATFLAGEMRVVYDIYSQWFRDTAKCLLDKGMSEADLEHEMDVIDELLAPYHQAIGKDRADIWSDIESHLNYISDINVSTEEKLTKLAAAKDKWRDLHDCEVDQLSGLFNLVISRFGENGLLEMYEGWVIGDWFRQRYQRFDVSKIAWGEASWLLTYLGFEGHHGHFSGTHRDGSIDFEEDDEKITISFAPCGSGGRSMEGEVRDGLPALHQKPFEWPLLEQAHDFTWNEKGICSYCAHCCILHEKLPIEHFGYPVRVTKPPVGPLTEQSRCAWTVYKDLEAIPEWAYERVGAKKPLKGVPLGSTHKALREQS
ncbi:hypothetical protein [Maritalea myrionectae]|uniref:hypothetical protein n=1 Tax=Maritalea myrionectae TaxID=454601 RepID=UPI000400DE38|nr:hypothetical protein [Maritalea myrionectae]